MTAWFAGGYGPELGGSAGGISLLDGPVDGALEYRGLFAPAESPSFLATAHGHLYAVAEGGSRVDSFRLDGTRDGGAPSGGDYPCHLTVLDDRLIVANYGDGTLGMLGLAPEGALTGSVSVIRPDPGSGPRPGQGGPHAHASLQVDRDTLLSLDLGTDRVHSFAMGASAELTSSVVMEAGTGPRDAVALGTRVLVLGELSGVLVLLERAGEPLGSLVFAASAPLPGWVEGDHAAGIAVNGEFVYAGVRGSDRIAVLRWAADGGLDPIGSVASGGRGPRHLVTDGDMLHVANQLSDSVATFVIHPGGMPAHVGSVDVPSPTYLLRG